MKTKLTHVGIVRGSDNRTPDGYCYRTKLRETANFWVTEKGTKYRKKTGSGLNSWPMYRLDISTIKPISEQ